MPHRLIENGVLPVVAYFTAGLCAFFTPLLWAFWVVIGMVAIDTVLGVMSAGKTSVKEIKSRKMFSLVPKTIAYICFVIVAGLLKLVEPSIPFVQLALFGICFIEVKSIDENVEKLTGFSIINKALEAFKTLKDFKRK